MLTRVLPAARSSCNDALITPIPFASDQSLVWQAALKPSLYQRDNARLTIS
jgi:hypothetical protein